MKRLLKYIVLSYVYLFLINAVVNYMIDGQFSTRSDFKYLISLLAISVLQALLLIKVADKMKTYNEDKKSLDSSQY